MKRNTLALKQISPIFLIIFSFAIILLLFFFVIQTLNKSIDMGMSRGMETTYAQYVRRERDVAREDVGQFISTIQYINAQPQRRENGPESILAILRKGTTEQLSGNGFFVFGKDNICLISYDYVELQGHSLDEIYNASGIDFTSTFEELRQGGESRFIQYKITNPISPRPREKTAYITYFKPWDWIVGAGFYSDGADSSLQGQKSLWKNFGDDIRHTVLLRLLIFSSILFFFIILSVVLVRRSDIKRMRIQNYLSIYRDALEENLSVMITDAKGKIIYVNDKYGSLTGHYLSDIKGDDFSIDFYQSHRNDQRDQIDAALQSGTRWSGVVMGQNTSGDPFWLQSQIKQIEDSVENEGGFIAVGMDITELQQTKTSLRRSIFRDPLTGCGNRAMLLSDYEKLEKPLTVLYNVDRFSNINHFYGIERGDEVLNQISHTLKSLLRGGETLYRLQADTFVIMKEKGKKEEFIEHCRTRMFVLNNLSFDFDNVQIPLSIRCGVSVSSRDSLIIADSALAATKGSSDGFIVYGDMELEDSRFKMDKVNKLNMIKLALSNSNLFLTYQPILDLASGNIRKYECLIRMKDDRGSIISPENFIELAKEGRLYKKITHYVIQKAFYVFQNRPEEFSINLTIEDFADRETIDLLIEQARLCQVQDRLILEIVETEELRDFEDILKIINRLKEEGIRIAIDDFGAGFSNFSYLLKLNADFIKIDGSLTKNILEDENSLSLVKSIIQFARKAGIRTIAEYIETEELQKFAGEIGIDFGQGYFIGKPIEWS